MYAFYDLAQPAETILDREQIQRVICEKNALVFTFWSPCEPYKQVDMFLTRENSFDDLVSGAHTLTIWGRHILVASRQKLIEMKSRVQPLREKDIIDILKLQRIDESLTPESGDRGSKN